MVSESISDLAQPATLGRSNHRGGGGHGAPAGRPRPLPCLGNNNSNEGQNIGLSAQNPEPPSSVRKCEFVLRTEVKALAKAYGLGRLGFFTLTFAENIQDRKEASRRFNSLLTGVLRERYKIGVRVMERQKSGRIHYHCVVVMPDDIREGFDFKEASRGIYGSANAYLRAEWVFWRNTCKEYGFGRHELMPVKSNENGLAKYVGKYLGKHWTVRTGNDVGARLVGYWGFRGKAAVKQRESSCNFSWAKGGAKIWRENLKTLDLCASSIIPEYKAISEDGSTRLKHFLGRHWAWNLIKLGVGSWVPILYRIEGMIAARKAYETGRPMYLAQKLYYAEQTRSNPKGTSFNALAFGQSGHRTKSACNRITEEDVAIAAAAMVRMFQHAPP